MFRNIKQEIDYRRRRNSRRLRKNKIILCEITVEAFRDSVFFPLQRLVISAFIFTFVL